MLTLTGTLVKPMKKQRHQGGRKEWRGTREEERDGTREEERDGNREEEMLPEPRRADGLPMTPGKKQEGDPQPHIQNDIERQRIEKRWTR